MYKIALLFVLLSSSVWGSERPKRQGYNLHFSPSVDVEIKAKENEDHNPSTTRRLRNWNRNNPITADTDPIVSYTVFNSYSYFSNNEVNLPLVVRAVITSNTAKAPRNGMYNVNAHFDNMDRTSKVDERGHIVAARLGGPLAYYNIFPQTFALNRGSGSPWFAMETKIHKFVHGHADRYVVFTAVLSYGTMTDDNLQHRADAIAVRVRAYKNGVQCDLNGRPMTPSSVNEYENKYFSNT